jgi:hypothetical protein
VAWWDSDGELRIVSIQGPASGIGHPEFKGIAVLVRNRPIGETSNYQRPLPFALAKLTRP